MSDPVIEALRKHAEYCEAEAEKAKRSILRIDEGVALALVCIAARLRHDIREREKFQAEIPCQNPNPARNSEHKEGSA